MGRFILGLPIAAVITVALFLLMRFFISGDVKIGEKQDAVRFDINPKVQELEVRQREVKPERTKDVKPPPPPPAIEKQKAVQPKEGIASISGSIPDFEPPTLNRGNINFQVSDRDAQPLVRIEPIYPPRAAEQGREGTCEGHFDVSADGKPYHISVTCSSSMFVRAATRAIQKWKYNPKIVDGKAVARRGVVTPFKFQLEK